MPAKSNLWQHFVKNPDQSGTCRYCGKVLKTKGNTSNLKCHLQSKHQTIFSQFEKSIKAKAKASKGKGSSLTTEKQKCDAAKTSHKNETRPNSPITSSVSLEDVVSLPSCSSATPTMHTELLTPQGPLTQATISQAFKKIESFKDGGTLSHKITQAIIYMICKDYQPFSIVEHNGFNKLMKTVAPHYVMPSRFTIKRMVIDKFDALSSIMKLKLSNKKCTLTTDIWTDIQMRSFISVTVHFYDDSYDRLIHSGTIGVFMLQERHTAENIAKELKEICNDWNIEEENILAVVTDNASNIKLAIEIGFGRNKHIPCFAHTLNLVSEKGLQNTDEAMNIISKVKSIVTWFKQSVVASDELRQKTDKKLIQSVVTRWNSVYYMIERFLELRPYVNEIVNQHTSAPPMLNAAEIEILKDLKAILEPLEAATSEISGQHYVTGSSAIPIANITKGKLNGLKPSTEIGKLCQKKILDQFSTRFCNIEQVHLLALATIMDPRFKKIYFENPIAYSKVVTFLNSALVKMDKELTTKKISTDSSSESDADVGLPPKKKSLFSEHNKTVQKNWRNQEDGFEQRQAEPRVRKLHHELALYLGAPAEKIEQIPLVFWRDMASSYPLLSELAKDYLTVMATSVPSEQLFSKVGQIVTKSRNRLSGKLISKIVFLQSIDDSLWA